MQRKSPPSQSLPRRAGGSGGAKPPRHSAPAGGNEPPRRRKKKKKTPLWLPLAVTLAVLAVISGVVVYAAGMVSRVEENLRPEEDAPSITEEIQTLEEYKGDVVNILVCGIDYEEGRNYSNDPTSNDGMTDMILYCQFDIKGGALRMLQIPRNSLVATKGPQGGPLQRQDLRRHQLPDKLRGPLQRRQRCRPGGGHLRPV